MLTTVFVITGNDPQSQAEIVSTNVKLLKTIDNKRHVSLVLGGITAKELELDAKFFDRIYETESSINKAHLVARALPKVEGDQVLYLDNSIFTLDALHSSYTRILKNGVHLASNILDFRGNWITMEETWLAQQLMNKHNWPVVSSKIIWLNKDKEGLEFFNAFEQFSENWEEIAKDHSDGAFVNDSMDNILSFTSMTHSHAYSKSSLLNFRSLDKRQMARDKSWIQSNWYDWLDVWWTTSDGFHLRIENFRQIGMIELTGDCLGKINQWLEQKK